MQIFKDPNYDFIKWRWHAVVISLIFIGAGAALFFTKGINLGIDFAGGANIILKFKGDPPLARLRGDLPKATIQQYGKPADNALLIRLPKQETDGPQVGAQLQRKALWAIVLSSLAMGIYIWLRFDLKFGVAAMICIIHD